MEVPGLPHEDRTGSLGSLFIVVLAAVVVLLLAGILAYYSRASEQRQQGGLTALATSNPQQDAREAMGRGDVRFLALPAFRSGAKNEKGGMLRIPGVGEFAADDPSAPSARLLGGISGMTFGNQQEAQYVRAQQYAEEYNKVILEERTKRGESHP